MGQAGGITVDMGPAQTVRFRRLVTGQVETREAHSYALTREQRFCSCTYAVDEAFYGGRGCLVRRRSRQATTCYNGDAVAADGPSMVSVVGGITGGIWVHSRSGSLRANYGLAYPDVTPLAINGCTRNSPVGSS